ncbi:MAG: hypothetical protein ACERKD_03000 [Prolixibacteraceae bacterium]
MTKNKLIKAIPAIIVGIGMTTLLIWGVTNDKKCDGMYSFRTTGLKDPAPKGLPIYVKFMPNCSDCYEFLWDSIAASDLYKVKYTRQGHQRREYELLNNYKKPH